MFVCFHVGGLRSQICLPRILLSQCSQAILLFLLSLSLPLSSSTPHCPLIPASLSLSLLLPGDSPDGNSGLFLPSPRYSLGTALSGLLQVTHFPISALLGRFPGRESDRRGGRKEQEGQNSYSLSHPSSQQLPV